MSGSSLDGLDIAFVELNESGGKWSYEIKAAACYKYTGEWIDKLRNATGLSALDYQLLHTAYGRYTGEQVNRFINENNLHHQVQLIASHGHTTFHLPHAGMTGQLGDGASVAAVTEINVVSDLRAMDVAFGGQGAPIVPIGEKLLMSDYDCFLNIGGIANISVNGKDSYSAFDVCAANRVLNLLSAQEGKLYDKGGAMAASGSLHLPLLIQLNDLDYYKKTHPKSLANSFGTDEVYPLIQSYGLPTHDALRTYVEHIVIQVTHALEYFKIKEPGPGKLLITGGGAFNRFLIERLQQSLEPVNIAVTVPEPLLVNFKEALIMALIGVLRWREEYNVLSTVTGAKRSSIGGAVWIGQEA